MLAAIARRCAEVITDTDFTLARPVVNATSRMETDVRSWRILRYLGEEQ